MVGNAELQKIGLEIGATDAGGADGERKPGRPVGAVGEWPSPKGKDKKSLERMIWGHRKEIKELRAKVEQLPATGAAVDRYALTEESTMMGQTLALVPVEVFARVSVRYGEYWKLTEREAAAYALALARVWQRYGGAQGEYAELIGLAIVTGASVTDRVLKMRQQKNEAENARRVSGDDGVRPKGDGENIVGQEGITVNP